METKHFLFVSASLFCNFQSVVGFAYGSGPHVLAYTQSGDLYSWGHNGYSQVSTRHNLSHIEITE